MSIFCLTFTLSPSPSHSSQTSTHTTLPEPHAVPYTSIPAIPLKLRKTWRGGTPTHPPSPSTSTFTSDQWIRHPHTCEVMPTIAETTAEYSNDGSTSTPTSPSSSTRSRVGRADRPHPVRVGYIETEAEPEPLRRYMHAGGTPRAQEGWMPSPMSPRGKLRKGAGGRENVWEGKEKEKGKLSRKLLKKGKGVQGSKFVEAFQWLLEQEHVDGSK